MKTREHGEVRRGSSAVPKFLVLLLGLKSFTPLHTASHTRERTGSAFTVQTKAPVDGAQKFPTPQSLRGAKATPVLPDRLRARGAASVLLRARRRPGLQDPHVRVGSAAAGSGHSPVRWETGPRMSQFCPSSP